MIGFFCFLTVPVGLLRGQDLNILSVDKLNLDKIVFDVEDDREIDLKLIADQQEEYFETHNKYFHIPEFGCLVGRCQVDEYVTPTGEVGYLTIFKKTLNEQTDVSMISSGVEDKTIDWFKLDNLSID